MGDARQERMMVDSEGGFSLVEVLISIAITVVVMGAVFGLLTRGQRSFRREPEVADLQQSARAVLDMVTKDILQAGAGLPPEFPAFSRIRGGDGNPTDSIEVIGTFQSAGNIFLEPEDVAGIGADGPNTVTVRSNTTNLEVGNLVVVYNNVPNNHPLGPQWAFGRVAAVQENGGPVGNTAFVTLDYGAVEPAYSRPPLGESPQWATFASPSPNQRPKITRISVVRYFTQPDNPELYNGTPPEVLMRDVDFGGAPQAVGQLGNFQIRYVVGVTAPFEQDNPPDPVTDLPGVPLTAENMLASVRISVTGRSVSQNLEGSTLDAANDALLRRTFSTNVNPRNVSAGLDTRALTSTP